MDEVIVKVEFMPFDKVVLTNKKGDTLEIKSEEVVDFFARSTER